MSNYNKLRLDDLYAPVSFGDGGKSSIVRYAEVAICDAAAAGTVTRTAMTAATKNPAAGAVAGSTVGGVVNQGCRDILNCDKKD